MDKRNKKRTNLYLFGCVASRPLYGEFGSCPIDKVTAQGFNVDPATGRPMSDIDYIIHSRDASQEMALFMQLNDYKSSFLPKEVSDSDAIKFSVPRYAQTPAELADLTVKYAKYKLERAEAAKRAADLEEYRRSFDEKPVEQLKTE